jgi:alkylhydroperoxidase family enzyme
LLFAIVGHRSAATCGGNIDNSDQRGDRCTAEFVGGKFPDPSHCTSCGVVASSGRSDARLHSLEIVPMSARPVLAAIAACLSPLMAIGAEPSTSEPRPVPVTRPAMKQLLEEMKERKPRIPVPESTDDAAGPRGGGYEGRLRSNYLPADADSRSYLGFGGSRPGGGGGAGRGPMETDPNLSLDYKFKTMLFWIASRSNNCQYCLGHQESKLLSAGMTEDEVAALDCEWEAFTPAEQAAFALARRLTLEPHKLTDADIERCRKHYTDLQMLEMIVSIAGNNAINRWKEGTGVPQSQGGGRGGGGASVEHSYLTPTSPKFTSIRTKVAPIFDPGTEITTATKCDRPPLETGDALTAKLKEAAERKSRLPLVDESEVRTLLGDAAPSGSVPNWMRLLANFPVAGKRLIQSQLSNDAKGDLTPLLKAQMSYVIGRQDRAWYAVGQSHKRLLDLGQTEAQITALDGERSELSPADRDLILVAKNLAASPVVLTDEQVAAAVATAGPRLVTQAISFTTFRAQFDRITEAAGLPVD